ncbi:MAG: DNA-protecting protein DprA [Kangiellaceae bacterium]|nr:DNA-protecting protein DprA [Kangiellaceae bacterium]
MRDSTQLSHWLAISQINVSGHKLLQYLTQHPDISSIFQQSDKQLQRFGFRAGLADKLKAIQADQAKQQKIEQDLAWFDSDDKHLIPINSPDYPALLKQIADPPKLLFVQGNKACLSQHQIAIVGSRNPSLQGKSNAIVFAKSMAQAGAVITSGLALGVDGYAHQAALDNNSPTIAVAGTGLDRVYPARHKQLAEQIVQKGALVSEFALGTGVRAGHFPARNRIISGLSLGTLVVEATIKSGSLITARLAMEQGREVFAIPGSIHNPLARGCHRLIKQGAKLVETGEEIIEELAALAQWQNQQNDQCKQSIEFELDNDYQQLLEQIDYDQTSMDKIIKRSGLEIEVVSHMILLLELNDYIASVPGGYQRLR